MCVPPSGRPVRRHPRPPVRARCNALDGQRDARRPQRARGREACRACSSSRRRAHARGPRVARSGRPRRPPVAFRRRRSPRARGVGARRRLAIDGNGVGTIGVDGVRARPARDAVGLAIPGEDPIPAVPASMMSVPWSPDSRSSPAPPATLSLPSPPVTSSPACPPATTSAPEPPSTVTGTPAPPWRDPRGHRGRRAPGGRPRAGRRSARCSRRRSTSPGMHCPGSMPPSTLSSRNSIRPASWRTTRVLSDVASAEYRTPGRRPSGRASARRHPQAAASNGSRSAMRRRRVASRPERLLPRGAAVVGVQDGAVAERQQQLLGGPAALNFYGSPATAPTRSQRPPPSRERRTVPSFSAR